MENSLIQELSENIKLNMKQKIMKELTKANGSADTSSLELIIEELALLKAQLLSIELDFKQIESINLLKSIKYSPEPGISNFNIFEKGEKFDVCSEVYAFNLRPPLKSRNGITVRWSGPSNIFGFLARINRDKDINVTIPILKKGSDDVVINLVEIDGIAVHLNDKKSKITFEMPKRTKNILGDITTFTLKTNQTTKINEDYLGVCLKYIELS